MHNRSRINNCPDAKPAPEAGFYFQRTHQFSSSLLIEQDAFSKITGQRRLHTPMSLTKRTTCEVVFMAEPNLSDLPHTGKEALALGAKYYSNGVLCKRGHLAPRSTEKGFCVRCNYEIRTEWAKKNPDRIKTFNNAYEAKHTERIRQNKKEWKHQALLSGRSLEIAREWRRKNRARVQVTSAARERR